MRQFVLQEKYPVFHLEIDKAETSKQSVDEIIADIKAKIDANDKVAFIAVFDHYSHTKDLGGDIAPDIQDAKNIVFCFGLALPNPEVMAVRPRSIGVADLGDKFVITFMEAPMPMANTAMEDWVKGLRAA